MKQKNGCMNVVEDKKSEKAFVLEVCMKNKLNVIVVVLLIVLGFTSCTSHMNQSESDEIYAEKIIKVLMAFMKKANTSQIILVKNQKTAPIHRQDIFHQLLLLIFMMKI